MSLATVLNNLLGDVRKSVSEQGEEPEYEP